ILNKLLYENINKQMNKCNIIKSKCIDKQIILPYFA
ncbi:unnamed protein product, partial [marine sediment metagenome]